MSYLNTVPLVWGMLHGPQTSQVELSFSVPSLCALQIERDDIEVGLVPVAEIARQALEIVPGVGITCLGPVRSILLFSRIPWKKVRTVSADSSSRTSVQLARILLRENFGIEPAITRHTPALAEMLEANDAALVIGDPALRLDPETLPFEYLDLGSEWFKLTGLPMVFAAWAAKPGLSLRAVQEITLASYAFGHANLEAIVESEFKQRGISKQLADRYLHRHIRFEIGSAEERGLDLFLKLANLGDPIVAGYTSSSS